MYVVTGVAARQRAGRAPFLLTTWALSQPNPLQKFVAWSTPRYLTSDLLIFVFLASLALVGHIVVVSGLSRHSVVELGWMESPKSATAVPSITELRKQLDYGDVTLPRCQTFHYDTRMFRGKFISSQGVEGSNLYLWKVPSHQQGLDEMTDTFLLGNGTLYWPDDPASPRHNRWQYSKHRIHIRSLLKQLFFRLNLQHHRNLAYKHKRDRDKSDPFRIQKGGSKDDPIELTSVDDDVPGDDPPAARVTSDIVNDPPPTIQQQTTSDGPIDPDLAAEPPNTNAQAESENGDPYSGPRSPVPPGSENTRLHSRFSPINPPAADVNSVQDPATETNENERPYKRIKIVRRDKEEDASGKKAAGPKRKAKRGKRVWSKVERNLRGPGARTTRRRPDMATESDIEAGCASSTSVDSHSDVPSGAERTPSMSADNAGPRQPTPRNPDNAGPSFSSTSDKDAQQPPPAPQGGSARAASLASEGNARPARPTAESTPRPVSSTLDATTGPQPSTDSNPAGPAPSGSNDTAVPPFPIPESAHGPRPSISEDIDGLVSTATPSPMPSIFNEFILRNLAQQNVPAPFAEMTSSSFAFPPPTVVSDREAAFETQSPVWSSRPSEYRNSVSSEVTAAEKHAGTPTAEPVKTQHLPQPQPPPPSVRQPKIAFAYSVVESRSPSFVARRWVPKSRFKEMVLSQFEQELPLQLPADAKGWLFTLTGPGVEVVDGVHRGKEDEYRRVTMFLDRAIRNAIPNNVGLGCLDFHIEIEAMMDEDYRSKKMEEYDGELDF